MVVEELRRELGPKPRNNDQQAVQDRYAVLIDLKDGDPPRRVESVEWDHEHKAVILTVD